MHGRCQIQRLPVIYEAISTLGVSVVAVLPHPALAQVRPHQAVQQPERHALTDTCALVQC